MSGILVAAGVQMLLPLGLLIRLLIAPAGNKPGFFLRALGAGLSLAALRGRFESRLAESAGVVF